MISNSEPSPSCDADLLKARLKNQMTSGVRWRETMDVILSKGIDTLVEIGPGNVLTGLNRRINREVQSSKANL